MALLLLYYESVGRRGEGGVVCISQLCCIRTTSTAYILWQKFQRFIARMIMAHYVWSDVPCHAIYAPFYQAGDLAKMHIILLRNQVH